MSRGGFGGRGRGGGFRGRGGFGGRGRGGGGRGGFNRYDAGPPDTVTELGQFTHACEDDIVCKVNIKDVPFFNAPIFFENKQQIGQIDEIFGPVHDYFVSVKLAEDVKANSFAKDQKIYIDPNKLLPLQRFLPKAPGSTPGRGRGRGGRGGRGGGGRGGGFGRGRGGGFDRGRGGRGGFGRGGGGGYDRGGRGGFDRGGRGGFDRGGRGGGGYDRGGRGGGFGNRGGFDRGGFKRSFDGGNNNSFPQNKKTKFE